MSFKVPPLTSEKEQEVTKMIQNKSREHPKDQQQISKVDSQDEFSEDVIHTMC